jgi:hypothetical protein
VKLVLERADGSGGKYKLAPIHAEYSIVCRPGHAFSFQDDAWYAIALYVDGSRTPFLAHERVVMKVFDEQDYVAGSLMLREWNSSVYKPTGMHYFKAIDWRLTGKYRITFKVANARRFSEGEVKPLTFYVTATDPGE